MLKYIDNLSARLRCALEQRWIKIILVIIASSICGVLIAIESKLRLLGIFVIVGLLFFIKPHLALYTSVLFDLWYSYHETIVSPRTVILAFIIILFFVYFLYKKKFRFNKFANRIIFISCVLLLWGIVVDMLIQELSLTILYETAARIWLPVLIGLCLYLFIDTTDRFKTLLYIIVVGTTISGIVGIFQFVWGGFFWHVSPYSPIVGQNYIYGLSALPHIFASQLAGVIPLLFAIAMSKKRGRFIMVILVFIMIIALLLTLVRSAIFGCVAGVLLYFVLGRNRFLVIKMGVATVILALGLYGVSKLSESGDRLFRVDESALYRLPLALTAYHMALENPFGIGRGRYADSVQDYLEDVQFIEHHRIVLVATPHNQFLNVLVYWGFPGLILLVLFYYQIVRGITVVRRFTTDIFLKNVGTGLLCSFVAYLINSMFHNNGAFTGDPFHWYIIGITLCFLKLSDDGGER